MEGGCLVVWTPHEFTRQAVQQGMFRGNKMTGDGLRTAGDERRLEGSDPRNGDGGCGRILDIFPLESL